MNRHVRWLLIPWHLNVGVVRKIAGALPSPDAWHLDRPKTQRRWVEGLPACGRRARVIDKQEVPGAIQAQSAGQALAHVGVCHGQPVVANERRVKESMNEWVNSHECSLPGTGAECHGRSR